MVEDCCTLDMDDCWKLAACWKLEDEACWKLVEEACWKLEACWTLLDCWNDCCATELLDSEKDFKDLRDYVHTYAC